MNLYNMIFILLILRFTIWKNRTIQQRERGLLLPIAALFYCLMSWPLHAQEDYQLKSIEFHGNHTFSDRHLGNKIVMRGKPKLTFWKKHDRFSENVLQGDIKRIIRYYQTEGFLHAAVSSSFDIDQEDQSIKIIFNISEGSPILVQNFRNKIVTQDSHSESRVGEVLETIQSLALREGKRFRDAFVETDQKTIAKVLSNSGYPQAKVKPEFLVDTNKDLVDVIFHIYTGQWCFFGEVKITGNIKTPASAIRKQIAFEKGDIFSQELIQKSQRRIYQLGVFQYVTIKALLGDNKETIVPVQIVVKEAPRLTSKLGVGYGKEDRFRISLDLRRRGFLGGARRLNLFAKHSYLEPYHLSLKFIQPAFLNPRASLVLNPFLKQEKEPGFTIDRVGGNITYQQSFATFTDGYLNYSLEQDNLKISHMTREQALNNLDVKIYNKSSVTIGLARDSSTLPLFPNKGMFTSLTTTLSGLGFESDFHYARIALEGRRYHEFYDGWILAYRVMI